MAYKKTSSVIAQAIELWNVWATRDDYIDVMRI